MSHLQSFTVLFVTALGLVFVAPNSPISVLSSSLELQNPVASLIAGSSPGVDQGSTNVSGGNSVTNVTGGNGGTTQTGGGSAGTPLQPPLKDPTIKGFLTTLLNELVKIGYVIGVIYIVYSGFLFVTGGESDAKRTKARNTLMWTIIGIGILLAAQAIALIVSATIEAIANSTT